MSAISHAWRTPGGRRERGRMWCEERKGEEWGEEAMDIYRRSE
jgi:hypothetical protein